MLEAELKRLEAEYNMFFAGRLPRPPWETRTRVTGLFKKFDRIQNTITNYGVKFRFQTLQSRFTSQIDLWDRGLRSREEGRARAVRAAPKTVERPKPAKDRVLAVTTFSDPLQRDGQGAGAVQEAWSRRGARRGRKGCRFTSSPS